MQPSNAIAGLRAALLAGALLAASCQRHPPADPWSLALAPLASRSCEAGGEALDREISTLQDEARSSRDPAALARLGWKLVAKARLSCDPGYYKLAEQCALCLEQLSGREGAAARDGLRFDALLLRGHALHSLHRFKEAEEMARELVRGRGSPADHGLLGDVVMEQGRLAEAAAAYQTMVDLRPSLQSYARAAHCRWLKGDLAGAAELAQMAARAGSRRDGESVAWAATRLALYRLQAGSLEEAAGACRAALQAQGGYAPALLAEGRVLLARGRPAEALESFQRAARINPLPEYEWILADALRAAAREVDAQTVESRVLRQGRAADPRTFALYLATRGQELETAVRLARRELAEREDIFTHDALAWALAAQGKNAEASERMALALAEGTEDARLFLHAGVIARAAGKQAEAARWLEKASAIQQMLLPSEQEFLGKDAAPIGVVRDETQD